MTPQESYEITIQAHIHILCGVVKQYIKKHGKEKANKAGVLDVIYMMIGEKYAEILCDQEQCESVEAVMPMFTDEDHRPN